MFVFFAFLSDMCLDALSMNSRSLVVVWFKLWCAGCVSSIGFSFALTSLFLREEVISECMQFIMGAFGNVAFNVLFLCISVQFF